ncbi:prephenate dehydrogenase [Williamsia sterculiae]|uniref:Prephenate dehydrogenase n=1 Tax=Williamsia sterculiae TaxID=1344003 RepID=A0A1N7FDG7_9NOCA|nr:prephenate dehydrogenase [Williamsia sterculiae]SIR98389.1 prephenate dehydrogenase [Williamsia sterculiae]
MTNATVCVVGLGLIGGSLLRAATAAGVEAFGYNRSAVTVEQARAAGHDVSDDLGATLDRAARASSLIVIATPMTALDPVLDAIAVHAPDCALTDVISVKRPVADAVATRLPGVRYVGGHPMAGTSRSGWEATDPGLFRGAVWVVAADDGADPDVWLRVAALATAVGSVVIPVATDEHDRAVAAISHLPHLTAAVTATIGGADGDLPLRLAAGSFRDGTRVAGTAPLLQRAIVEGNRLPLLNALSETIDRLTAARDELRDHGTVKVLVDDGHRARLRYDELSATPAAPVTGVRVGDPGWERALRHQAYEGRAWQG